MTMTDKRLATGVMSSAILAASLTGCGSGSNCSGATLDYGTSAHGEVTPSKALTTLLAKHPQGLPASGWKRDSNSTVNVVFRSGSSQVSVFQVPDTSWVVDHYTSCT
jgi:hypothetical protein